MSGRSRQELVGRGVGEKGYGWLPYEYVLEGLADDWWSLLRANGSIRERSESRQRDEREEIGMRSNTFFQGRRDGAAHDPRSRRMMPAGALAVAPEQSPGCGSRRETG